MEYICGYFDDDELFGGFNGLAGKVFGIDFSSWRKYGNGNYIPHSFAENGKVKANVSVSLMNMRISGSDCRGVQIGTVMTEPACRGKGLAASLIKKVIDEYSRCADIFFLFANDAVLDFYPKFGFIPYEQKMIVSQPVFGKGEFRGARILEKHNDGDADFLKNMASSRDFQSGIFGINSPEELVLWHFLNDEHLTFVYLDELKLIVVYSIDGKTLRLYDIIAASAADYATAASCILNENVERIEFYFSPDNPYAGGNKQENLCGDKMFYLSSGIRLPDNIAVPYLYKA